MSDTERYGHYTRLTFDRPHPKVLRVTMSNGKMNSADAAMHGVLMVIEKWANLAGQVRYALDRGRGRSPRLIEYKHPGASRAAQ